MITDSSHKICLSILLPLDSDSSSDIVCSDWIKQVKFVSFNFITTISLACSQLAHIAARALNTWGWSST